MTKRRSLGILLALLMVAAFCLPVFAACKDPEDPDKPEPGPGPDGPAEMTLTDGYFEASVDGLTWTLVLKENGTYYWNSITGARAGTWEEADREIQYICNFNADESNPDQESPEYATAESGVTLHEYNGDTQTVAYADGKLWNIMADYGMSMRNLTQKAQEWNEASEMPVTVVQYYDQKDSAKSVRLTHDFKFRDTINGKQGTWENGSAAGSYTLTAGSDQGSLTLSADGSSAEYVLGGSTVTLYKTSFSPVYEFTATVDITLAGAEEPSNLAFVLRLYDNGDGATYDGDADFAYFNEDDEYILVDSGKYTYDDGSKTFAFTQFDNEANNKTVTAEAGAFSYTFTDAAEGGVFAPTEYGPAAVTVTYKLPPIYTMEADYPEGKTEFATVNLGGEGMDLTVTELSLEVLESGDAYIRSTVEIGPTLSPVLGTDELIITVDEGVVESRSGNVMTIAFANGGTVTTSIDADANEVATSGYTTKEPVDMLAGTGLPLPVPATYTLENIVFTMRYVPSEVYSFTSSDFAYSNIAADDGYMPSAVTISALDDGSYQIVNTLLGVAQVAQTGTWKETENGIDFTAKDGAEVTFSAVKDGTQYVIGLEIAIGSGVSLATDYGTLTGTFTCPVPLGQAVAALAGDKSSAENFASVSVVYGMGTMTIDETSLELYDSGIAVLKATFSVSMPTMGIDIPGVPNGTLDTAAYTVEGDIYTFTFAHAGTLTGTVVNGVLTLDYAGDAVFSVADVMPDLASMLGILEGTAVPGMNFTLSGEIA